MIALVPKDSLVGVITGPILWTVYFVLSYFISGVGCSLGYGEREIAGISVIQLLLLIVAAVTALLILLAGIQAERGRRDSKQSETQMEDEDNAPERQRFLYSAAAVLCALSLVGTIWLGMAAVIAPVC